MLYIAYVNWKESSFKDSTFCIVCCVKFVQCVGLLSAVGLPCSGLFILFQEKTEIIYVQHIVWQSPL